MEAKARAVLEAAEPFWRDVLMRLQLLGATSTVIAQFFERTRLEGSATVVCPNGFVRDWLRERWAVPLSEVLGELATFVTEAEWTAQQAEPAIPDVSA